jgi:hypothetical protein
MHPRPKKKGAETNKNFGKPPLAHSGSGPVQQIKMPNFAGIKKQFDSLQQQYMENPAAAK